MKRDDKELKTDSAHWWEIVRSRAESLRYGVVQVVIHDSRVVQIECTEKLRFDRPKKFSAADQIPGGLNESTE